MLRGMCPHSPRLTAQVQANYSVVVLVPTLLSLHPWPHTVAPSPLHAIIVSPHIVYMTFCVAFPAPATCPHLFHLAAQVQANCSVVVLVLMLLSSRACPCTYCPQPTTHHHCITPPHPHNLSCHCPHPCHYCYHHCITTVTNIIAITATTKAPHGDKHSSLEK